MKEIFISNRGENGQYLCLEFIPREVMDTVLTFEVKVCSDCLGYYIDHTANDYENILGGSFKELVCYGDFYICVHEPNKLSVITESDFISQTLEFDKICEIMKEQIDSAIEYLNRDFN